MVVRITYFVHGTTTDNEKDLASGHNDVELSELGVRQSEELKRLLSDRKFDAVFSSDLKRAVETARLAFGGSIQDKRLREADYGEFTSRPSSEFKHRMREYVDSPFPGGESYRDVENRIKSFLKELSQKYQGKRIAIVAHQAPQLALEVILNKKTWNRAIDEDWRKTKAWKPGWDYVLK